MDAKGVDVVDHTGAASRLDCYVTLWAAGVQASPLAKQLADACGARGSTGPVASRCCQTALCPVTPRCSLWAT